MTFDVEARVRAVLGLNKYQASAYTVLLKSGPMRAQEVARAADIPQQRVYDTLRSLVEMGLVIERDGAFEATNPVESLGLFAKREIASALARAGDIERLAQDLQALRGSALARPVVMMLKGMASVMGAALREVADCDERPLFIAYKVFDRLGQLLPVLRALASQAGPGTRVILPRGYLEKYAQYKVEFERYGLLFTESDLAFIDLMIACDTVIIGVPYLSDVIAVMIKDKEFAEGLRKGVTRAVGL
ncbi:MAG: TrmB family transcriptional regulator [Acidilobus sp.]